MPRCLAEQAAGISLPASGMLSTDVRLSLCMLMFWVKVGHFDPAMSAEDVSFVCGVPSNCVTRYGQGFVANSLLHPLFLCKE